MKLTKDDLFKVITYNGDAMPDLAMKMLEKHGEGFASLAESEGDPDIELCAVILQDCITHMSASGAIISLVARRLNAGNPLIAIQKAMSLHRDLAERAEKATVGTIMSFEETVDKVRDAVSKNTDTDNPSGVTH